MIRRGRPDDGRACHALLWHAVTDLATRRGTPLEGTADEWWDGMRTLHEQLDASAAEWWVAEDAGDQSIVGYARSIERDGLFELTEFFVRPGRQSAGLGRQLLELAFPAGRGEVRSIIATTDERALRRYYEAGVVAQFPFLELSAKPAEAFLPHDLGAEPIEEGNVDAVIETEREILGYARGVDEIRTLLGQREGWLVRRDSGIVGYAFVGVPGSGPVGALDPVDLPALLLLVEGRAHALGVEKLELEVPSVAVTAVRHLLRRGFRFSPSFNLLMSDKPFGQFDRYVPFSPPLFL